MQAIWVFAVLALASADVSHLGYNYKVPHTSYGVPSYQVGSSSQYSGLSSPAPGIYKGAEGQYLGSSFSHGDNGVPSHLTGDAQLSASTLNGGVLSGLYNGANAYGSGYNAGYSSGNAFGNGLGSSGLSSGQYYQTIGGPSTVQPIYLTGSNQYHTTQYQAGEKYQQFYQVQSQEPAKVYKHFYVHSAPEELELPKPRTPIVVPPPQKHYKIIFVKTPNPVSHSSQIVPVQPQNEEKTIVYVLVKKPEEHREVIVPKVEQKPPTKPEVYFIKYNNKEDSQAVINNIVNDYNKPGQSVSFSTGGSEGSPVLTGIPSSGYVSDNSGLSDVPSFSSVPAPAGGFITGFTKYPSSSNFANLPSPSISSVFSNGPSSSFSGIPSSVGSTFSSVPSSGGSSFSSSPSSGGSSFSSVPSSSGSSFSSVPSSSGSSFSSVPSSVGSSFSGVPSSLSTGSSFSDSPSSFSTGSTGSSSFPSSSLSNKFGSSGSNTGSSGSVSSLNIPSGSNSGLSGGSISGLSSIFGSSQSDSTIPSTVSTPASSDSANDAGVAASSIFSGVSSPSVSTSDDLNTVSGSQGLPHETYGVPKFRVG